MFLQMVAHGNRNTVSTEQDGKQVIAHMILGHRISTGGDTALKGLAFLLSVTARANKPRDNQGAYYEQHTGQGRCDGERRALYSEN